ncbi:MAG: hypothetical protein LBU65_07470 [Planctomycetaceae bacterium]|jgi:hypothetical protein|nr:hypothetical protein [Planctomycetaceae bacterium]
MLKDKIYHLLRDFRNYGLFNFLRRISNVRLGYRHSLKAFWYPDIDNFGDIITPLLLSSNKIVPISVPRKSADLICCGSILGGVPSDYNGVIFGSGYLFNQSINQSINTVAECNSVCGSRKIDSTNPRFA